MKLFKNQRGDAHMIVMFALLFGVIGIVGLAVSRAATTGGRLGNGIYGNVNVLGPKAQKNPFRNAKVNIYNKVDCPVSTQAQVVGVSASASVCNAPSKASVSADWDGNFSASLDPGDYTVFVDLSGFNDNNNRACGSANVSAKGVYYAHVDLTCTESGISGLAVITPSNCTGSAGCEEPYLDVEGRIRKSSSSSDATPLESFATDGKGSFTVKLPADTYIVTIVPKVHNGSNQPAATCKEQTVVVSSNEFADAKITCVPKPLLPPPPELPAPTQTIVNGRVDITRQREVFTPYQYVSGAFYAKTAPFDKIPFKTDGNGSFTIKVNEGTYDVVVPPGEGLYCQEQRAVFAHGETSANVRIFCHPQ